jgi:hypothetical protein
MTPPKARLDCITPAKPIAASIIPRIATGRFASAKRIRDRLMDDLTKAYDGKVQMIDTSTVRVHQHAAGARKGVKIVPQSRSIDTCCRRCPGPTYLSDAYAGKCMTVMVRESFSSILIAAPWWVTRPMMPIGFARKSKNNAR